MGKPTGFMEWQRAAPHRRAIDDRLRDWREVETTADPAESKQQGGRCMDCGVPFCTQGCPLGNPIPDFAHAVWTDGSVRWRAAHDMLAVIELRDLVALELEDGAHELAVAFVVLDQKDGFHDAFLMAWRSGGRT